jgi:hypothetical protein
MSTGTRQKADQAIKAKEMVKGASVEGYIKSFVTTKSNFNGKEKTEEHPLLVAKDGKTTLIWKGGNITSALKEALKDNEAPMGSYVKIKCLGPKGEFKTAEGVKLFNKFNVSVDSSDVLSATASSGSGEF